MTNEAQGNSGSSQNTLSIFKINSPKMNGLYDNNIRHYQGL